MPPINHTENGDDTNNNKEPINRDWINEDLFASTLIEQFGDKYKIRKIQAISAFGGGENYASEMLRIEIDLELPDETQINTSYILKYLPSNDFGGGMVSRLNLFPKEIEVYKNILPKFEQIYLKNGKAVSFGPKCWKFTDNPKAILMEDLKLKNFTNVNRRDGLDMIHTQCTLRKLAEYHAASACINFKYSKQFLDGIFTEDVRDLFEQMTESLSKIYRDCMMKWPNGAKYLDKMKRIQDTTIERFIESAVIHENEFNVLNHGDLWCNNIMFQHNDDGSIRETYFVDYQVGKYGSPVQDLYYFIISSVSPDIKLKHFDYFIKYYHDHLIENLTLLKYSKALPTLSSLHIALFKNGFWGITTATGVLSAALLDPRKDACIENYMESTEKAVALKTEAFTNARYVAVVEELFPWFDNRGLLE